MAKSKVVALNRKIAETVVGGYRKVEETVVGGYQKIQETAVDGYNKVADAFVDNYLTQDGESVEEARKRLEQEESARREKSEKVQR